MKLVRLIIAAIAVTAVCAGFSQASESERAAIGKLGQLNRDVNIYQKPTTNSRVLYVGKKDTYVAMRSMDEEWICIVMVDGSNGYVRSEAVTRLPYEVSLKKNEPSSAPRVEASNMQNRGSNARILPGGDWRAWCVREAFKYVGTPYVFGGNSLTRGIDCSGLVQQLFRQVGVEMPRTAAEQIHVGQPIHNLAELRPGDRLYFTDRARQRVTHTGLYVGDGIFIHASRSGGGVNTSKLEGSWITNLVGARR